MELISYICSMEKWKQIKEFTNYEISSYGRVRTGDRILKAKPFRYISILLTKDKKGYRRYLHRLVAKAFIPNEKEQVNHKDGNKLNNHVDNLEWVTRSENALHAYKTGLITPYDRRGKKNPNYRHGNRMNKI